jgi:hypothetical protein
MKTRRLVPGEPTCPMNYPDSDHRGLPESYLPKTLLQGRPRHLWSAVDHEMEVLESYAAGRLDIETALSRQNLLRGLASSRGAHRVF